MPRGLSKIKQASAEAKARQKAFDEGGGGQRPFILEDGETALVRFLEQGDGVWSVYTHQLPAPAGRQWGDSVMCLDQDNNGTACPGCQHGKGRSERVTINVIHYGAPKFDREPGKDGRPGKAKKDGNGNLIKIGTEDAVCTWNASLTVGGRIEYLDSEHGGLTTGIYKVKREGTGKNTTYMIDFVRAETPSASDRKLFESKPDPRKIIKQLGYGDMERSMSGGGTASPQAGMGEPQPDADLSNNAFAQAAASGATGAFGSPVSPQEQQPSGGRINENAFGV